MPRTEIRAAGDVVYVVELGLLDRRAVAAFTLGQCHGMALAVHDRTGWPMVAAYNADGACQHVLTDAGRDRFVDISGARSKAQLLAESNFDSVELIDEPALGALSARAGWAIADPAASQPWVDQVIRRGTSAAELIVSGFLTLSVPVDNELELVFRWGGMAYVDVLLRRPGAPDTSRLEWRCVMVPLSKDGLRRVHFTADDLVGLSELWLDQRFDPEAARAFFNEHSRR